MFYVVNTNKQHDTHSVLDYFKKALFPLPGLFQQRHTLFGLGISVELFVHRPLTVATAAEVAGVDNSDAGSVPAEPDR